MRKRLSAIPTIDARRAEHLREHESDRFRPIRVNAPFAEFVHEKIMPNLDLGVRKLPVKHDLVLQIMSQLFIASRADKTLADWRDTSKPGVGLRKDVYDELKLKGVLIMKIGSEQSGMVTRYDLSTTAYRMLRKENFEFYDIVDPHLDRNSKAGKPSEFALVVIRDKDKNPISILRMRAAERRKIEEMETLIEAINRNNMATHGWVFYREINGRRRIDQPNIVVRSLFNMDSNHGGRLYSWTANGYTHLSKPERRTMLIDGERIAELDFSEFHPRILYHKAKIDFQGDVYQPEKVFPEVYAAKYPCDSLRDSFCRGARKLAKKVTNVILNADCEKSATGAVWKTVRDDKQFSKIAYGICQLNPLGIVRRVKALHKQIEEHFHTGVGLKLQAEDVWLMIDILTRFVDAGKPALGLHDAIICKQSDVDFARDAMESCYRERFHFDPVIKQDFPKAGCKRNPSVLLELPR
jgi:hypothetical protein